MSKHNYTRAQVDGYWDLTPANLGPAVKAALPNKLFKGNYHSTDVTLDFDDALTPAEISTLDTTVANTAAVFDPLPLAQAEKVEQIRLNTDALIAQGALWNSVVYMSTAEGRFDMMGIYTMGVVAATPGFWPKNVSSTDGKTRLSFANAAEFAPFFQAMSTPYVGWKESGGDLRDQVNAATTVAEVDAVVDNRTWPWV